MIECKHEMRKPELVSVKLLELIFMSLELPATEVILTGKIQSFLELKLRHK